MINNKRWNEILQGEYKKEYFVDLQKFLDKEYIEKTIFPPREEVFSAFELTDFDKVRVVILGQDPYHGKGQGHGLAFSVKEGIKLPPSLRNIYKEVASEYGYTMGRSGYLLPWAKQGVFLLNTVLTVEEGKAHSHKKKGWETFTDKIIEFLSAREEPIVFILWGKPAEKKKELIDGSKHLVLTSAHPSPLSASRGFFGNNHFIQTNEFLKEKGYDEIDWQIKDKGTLF